MIYWLYSPARSSQAKEKRETKYNEIMQVDSIKPLQAKVKCSSFPDSLVF
jgi:hypothetical protein